MSEVKEVYKAICAVQAALAEDGISKGRTNEQQGYKFRGIDDVYNALAPVLAKHGLCILPRMLSRVCEERKTAKGNALFYVTVEAEFVLVAASDSSMHTVKTYGEAMDSGDKATNKAMSAAYKYACMQTFAIPTEGDNEADATTPAVKPSKAAGKPITPNSGALDAISADRQDVLAEYVSNIVTAYERDDDAGLMENYEEVTDPAEKLALWSLLQGRSDIRSHIKKIGQDRKTKALQEAAKMMAAQTAVPATVQSTNAEIGLFVNAYDAAASQFPPKE